MPPMVKPKYLLCPKCEYDVGPSIAAGHELCSECGTALRITAQDDYGKPPPRSRTAREWFAQNPEKWAFVPIMPVIVAAALGALDWDALASVVGILAIIMFFMVPAAAARRCNELYFHSTALWRFTLLYGALLLANAAIVIVIMAIGFA